MATKRKMKRRKLGFNRLANRITQEYEAKGYSKGRARKIGRATAGKIAREKGR